MTTRRCRLVFAALGAAAIGFFALSATTTPSQAALWGYAKWCAVTNNGGNDMMWECVYDDAQECQPFIIAGNRGFCSLNPYFGSKDQAEDPYDDWRARRDSQNTRD
jgi:hypothetical protein